MGVIEILTALVPTLVDVVKSVEAWIKSEQSGASKKALAMQAAEAAVADILQGGQAVSTGGAAADWAAVAPIASTLIDAIASATFPTGTTVAAPASTVAPGNS